MSVFTENISDAFLAAIETIQPCSIVGLQFFCNDTKVLEYLVDKKIPIGLVVQKQQIWMQKKFRVKNPQKRDAAIKLRDLYDRLTPLPKEINVVNASLEVARHAPVTCLGEEYSTKKQKKCQKLMHHKIWLFLNARHEVTHTMVGSYNYSNHAHNNHELGLLLHGPQQMLDDLYSEWKRLRILSESLDYK